MAILQRIKEFSLIKLLPAVLTTIIFLNKLKWIKLYKARSILKQNTSIE